MTESKLKNIIVILVIVVLLLLTTISVIVTNHRVKSKQPEQKTIIITDTISKVVFDTVFIDHFVTKKLQLTDTLIKDSIIIDSVFVEIPISVYKLDTTFVTDSTRLDLSIQNSGYDVSLDTLSYKFTYQPTPVIKKKRHRFGFYVGPSVGVGYDYLNNKPVPTVGIGVGIGWTMKKY